ncbi:E3 ubiquitin-protein ligase rnf213-alpha-like [Saccoglossus kowalevskii]
MGSQQGHGNILSELAQGYVAVAKSMLDSILESILRGQIRIFYLNVLLENNNHFVELCKTIVIKTDLQKERGAATNMQPSTQDIIKILGRRAKELKAFETERKQISCFLGICETIQPVNLQALQAKLDSDVDGLMLTDICEPITLSRDSNKPTITYFNISPVVKQMLPPLENIHSSVLFQDLWQAKARIVHKEKSKDTGDDVLTVDDVANKVWKKVFGHISEIISKLQDGSLILKEVDEFFGRFENEYDQLENELKLLLGPRPCDWLKRRIQQIIHYHQLEQRLEAVEIVQDVKKTFNLTGNFTAISVLSSVRNADFKDRKLESIDDDVVNAGKSLAAMSRERILCLQQLVLRKDFIEWLRKEITSIQQLKVFVDLAMISAGETDMEVDRVKCLHQATTGFSSFIFDLKPDAGFHQLMKACESLWNALRNDKDLPKKLKDISHHLEWLKGVKESHGSVETSSLSQAEAINTKGIYTVGNIDYNAKDTPESVIRLLVQGDDSLMEDEDDEDEAASKDKNYNLDMLKDLQSKLMLVAGKAEQGRDEVERFTEILSGVIRLATAYLKLCAAGNVLFSEWKAIVYCKYKKKVSVMVRFGIDGSHDLKGTREVTTELDKLCSFMENCLKEWLEYVEEKRSEIYHLNYFTTEQLVILRRELAKLMSNEKEMAAGVYTLLASLKDSCTESDVKEALNAAFMEVGSQNNQEEMEMEPIEVNASMETPELEKMMDMPEESGVDLEKVKKFLQELVDEGLSEVQAKAAMQACDPAVDIDDVMAWYYQNMQDEELMARLCKEWEDDMEMKLFGDGLDDSTPAAERTVSTMTNVQTLSVTITRGEKVSSLSKITSSLLTGIGQSKGDLIEKLQQLWKDYQISLTAISFDDYLSLEHLGHTLQYLATKDLVQLSRLFPKYLNTGKPNLVVRPKV